MYKQGKQNLLQFSMKLSIYLTQYFSVRKLRSNKKFSLLLQASFLVLQITDDKHLPWLHFSSVEDTNAAWEQVNTCFFTLKHCMCILLFQKFKIEKNTKKWHYYRKRCIRRNKITADVYAGVYICITSTKECNLVQQTVWITENFFLK